MYVKDPEDLKDPKDSLKMNMPFSPCKIAFFYFGVRGSP